MEMPSEEQIAQAIAEGVARRETPEQLEERIDALCRLTDEDLAAMGIHPRPEPAAELDPVPEPAAPAFEPIPRKRRHDGWTAERQRAFIAALAETGCVSEACAEVGITPRSAYRLREHAKAQAFAEAWDHALAMASARLASIAFERAVHGSTERIYRDGVLVEERRKPSDKLLMWLLGHVDPVGFGWLSRAPSSSPDISFYKLQHARKAMPRELKKLSDIDPDDCPAEPSLPSEWDVIDDRSPRA